MKKIYTFFFAALAWHTASSQVEEEADSIIINDLSEIIVSANRWEQNLREVANKVSKVNTALIQIQNPQTAADLLGISNSVFIQKSQLGGGSPIIRGFSTNRVLLVVDGVRMNNAIFRSGNVQNVISLDPNIIQEAEVVFGPGSVIYGSDAIGGVMDFHTRTPKFSTTNELRRSINILTRYSSANEERTIHADVNLGGKKFSSLSSVTKSIYCDLRMGSNGPSAYTRPDFVIRRDGQDVVVANENENIQQPTGFDQWNLMQKFSFKPAAHLAFNYAFHFSETSDYSRYDRLILKEEGQFANAEWYYGPQKWMMNFLSAVLSKPSPLFDQVKFVAAHQIFGESRHSRAFGNARRTDRSERVDAVSINVDLDRTLGDKVVLFYGAELIHNIVGSEASRENIETGEVTSASTRYPNNSTWRSAAAYVSIKYRPFGKWLINGSVRYNDVSSYARFDNTFFSFPFEDATLQNQSVNGSLGMIFSPTELLKIYSNFSTGFRAPNIDDIGKVFDSEPGNVVVPNPNLSPEIAYNAEVGFAAIARDKFKIDVAAYYTAIDNAIARGQTTFNGQAVIDYDGIPSQVFSQQNISEIWVAGIQANVDWAFSEHFSLTSSYNYQRGKEMDPGTGRNFSPPHVAPSFGSAHLIFKKGKTKIDLYGNYNGQISFENLPLSERSDSHLYAKDENGNPYAPSWWTANIKGTYQLSKAFDLMAGIENIFDKRYRPFSSGIAAPGLNFIISVRAQLSNFEIK